jgi:hypothetical protein
MNQPTELKLSLSVGFRVLQGAKIWLKAPSNPVQSSSRSQIRPLTYEQKMAQPTTCATHFEELQLHKLRQVRVAGDAEDGGDDVNGSVACIKQLLQARRGTVP